MEIDLRQAKTIENYKVWDNVKILVQSYWDNYNSYIWQIIWFDDFTVNPTIVVAYLKVESSTATIEFAYINQKSQKYEITSLNNRDVPVTKSQIMEKFSQEISRKEQEILEIRNKREVFERLFGKYFDWK